MNASTQTSLHFAGQFPAWGVVVAAFGLAALMVWFYLREVRHQTGWLIRVPALLRGAAVFWIVLILTGPVIRQVTVERQLGRVILALDSSASMRLSDEPAESVSTTEGSESPTRWERVQKLLFDGPQPLLDSLMEDHDVEIIALRNLDSELVWWQRNGGKDRSGPKPLQIDVPANGSLTSLDTALSNAVEDPGSGAAVVLFSDGRHNAVGSPEERADALGELGVPVFTVGLGSEVAPADLSLLSVEFPESVFAEEQFRGSVTVRDSMPEGIPARVRVQVGERVLWEKAFTTTGKDAHRFEVQFPVQDLPEPLSDSRDEALRMLTVRVATSGDLVTAEKTRANNDRDLAIHVLDRRRKVLILDGRPRWETRYVHNHFDRDERWEVQWIFDDFSDSPSKGIIAQRFPASLDDLLTYDLVILGDLDRSRLPPERAEWLLEFVEKRGGGLILIDGQRGGLESWSTAPTESLIPVERLTTEAALSPPFQWSLSSPGATLAALRLAGTSTSNSNAWKGLPLANWTAPVSAGAGARVLTDLTDATGQSLPAMVFQSVGAGAVLYIASDEMWRWRYEVADRHHQRFWMQLASWVAAPPFQIDGGKIAISADRLRAESGEQVEIKVRLRDDSGSMVTDATPRAWVMQDGKEIANLELTPDETHAGVYRALTPPLRPGPNEIAVGASPTSGKSNERLTIHAGDAIGQEYSELTLNADLLRQMAEASAGEFLREDEVTSRLPELLQRLDRKQSSVTERNLWSSWWWFSAVLLLVTSEWLLRKRLKLI